MIADHIIITVSIVDTAVPKQYNADIGPSTNAHVERIQSGDCTHTYIRRIFELNFFENEISNEKNVLFFSFIFRDRISHCPIALSDLKYPVYQFCIFVLHT